MLSRAAPRRGARGLTFVELLFVLVILGLLAALVVVPMARRVSTGQAAALASDLHAVGNAILAFRQDVRRYPLRLTQLTSPPGPGSLDLCGRVISAPFRAGWRGPYLDRAVGPAGLRAGDAVLLDSLRRVPAGTGADALLLVVAVGVDSLVALEVERAFDGDGNFAAGAVRWSPAPAEQGRLEFGIPIRGC